VGKLALETTTATLAVMNARFDDWPAVRIAADYPEPK
jgi:hypothetical protein